MNYIYLGIFLTFACIHLYASYKKDRPLRNITKPAILLGLLGFYLETVNSPSWFIILALLFSWLGDVLLIPHGIKWFTAGGISFMASHIFFILGYSSLTNFNLVPIPAIIILGLVFVCAVTFIFIKLKPFLPKALFVPMGGYLLVNGAMNCFAIFRMISAFSLSSLITCIGALLFFVSDAILFFVRFNKNSKIKSHFLVMLTYSLAELLIVLGLIY